MTPSKLTTIFSQVKDPRRDLLKLHKLNDILLISTLAVICGADTWKDIETFAISKQEFLKTFLELPNGIPKLDTYRRVFAAIDSQCFENCFIEWVNSFASLNDKEVVAIDGKTLRGAKSDGKKSPIHMVSAWASEQNIVLGQVKTQEKSNEITAIPELLNILSLENTVVTIDAMGCQKEIATAIVKKDADYILAVKENQKELYQNIQDEFRFGKNILHSTSEDMGHGRIETRVCSMITDFQFIEPNNKWKKLTTVIKIDSIREFKNSEKPKETVTRYYISSLKSSTQYFQQAIRSHWGVENKLHWTLDVAFSEDASRKRMGNSAQNFSMITKIALNLLKNEKTAKQGLKGKRFKAAIVLLPCLLPRWMLTRCTAEHKSDKGCSKYKTYDQFVALTFGQLNKCLTLSDISTGIGISEGFILSLGLGQSPARSTMSDGNKKRSYKVFETLYSRLLTHYSHILSKRHQSHVIKEIKDRSIKLIDSTLISLCLSMFDWAKFRTAKGGIKIHTCWDDTMMIPDVVNITPAKLHDRYGLEQLVFEKGTIVVEDRAYFDFELMLQRVRAKNVFVTRIKTNTVFKTVEELELPKDTDQDILKDEIITLSSPKSVKTGISEVQLRLVHVYKADENKVIEIITNQLDWKARTIADLYKKRWDIELFFKAIKQNLQIKTFVGTSENAVKSQIYIALITYLLLQLIVRTLAKKKHAFSNFVEKIRICLLFCLTLDYVCNQVSEGAKRVRGKPQVKIDFQTDLFYG